jgi:hypothetical protein
MSDLNKAIVNNTEKRQRDNLPKVRGRDRPFADIQTPVSSYDRGSNPPKIELFNAVARLGAGLAQFGNMLGQRNQAIGHRWFRPLILDNWLEQNLVDPRGLIMHIHKNPFLLGTLPAALEGGLDVLIPVVASQEKADPTKNYLGVSGRRIIVSEKASIWRDSQPALAQHYEAAKC